MKLLFGRAAVRVLFMANRVCTGMIHVGMAGSSWIVDRALEIMSGERRPA